MQEIPYYYILDCMKRWTEPCPPCQDCGRRTIFFVRYTLKPLCMSCYRRRAKANTLGEVCIAKV